MRWDEAARAARGLLGGLAVERFDARSWPDEQIAGLFSGGFPQFIAADAEARRVVPRVRECFAHLDIALVEGERPVAAGWGVPIRWNGEVDDLPSGYTASLRRAVDMHDAGGEVDTLVICAGIVHPERKGGDLADRLVGSLVQLAEEHGLARVIAPLRPTLKHRYPLVGIEAYARWTTASGEPFDPWLRLHVRLGARSIALAPASQTMTGSVAEWEAWTGMALPVTGSYVIPDGLALLHVDREADSGTYLEPNVWVRHR